jgi:hypothetical protein
MKLKKVNPLKKIFGKNCPLGPHSKRLFIYMVGMERLLGKCPPIQMSKKIGEDAAMELSDHGYILGTLKTPTINYKKLGLDFSTKIEVKDEPKVLQIIREFHKQHKTYRKIRGYNGERDMIQLRFLIRNYNGHEVQKQIIPFFADEGTKKMKGEVGIAQFFRYAIKRLQKEFGKPSEIPGDLGVAKRSK